jgi:hypothetical protein
MVTGRKKEEINMDRIFLVTLSVKIPVVADSEEEARAYVLCDRDATEDAVLQVLETCEEEDNADEVLEVEEVTADSLLREHSEFGSLMPWGDDGDETIAERLGMDEEVDEDEDPEPFSCWGEPSHDDN